jgi:hypothetical protein
MSQIPESSDTIAARIDATFEAIHSQEMPRPHMGCSGLGHKCDRWLWLSFRWAVRKNFSGRMLRLFDRGQREENIAVSNLRAIGVDVRQTGLNQSRVDFGCHVSGSVDGVIEKGVPGAEKSRHVFECKTHNKKSFDDLEKNAVEKSKSMHYAQLQLYMLGLKIDRALYYAVCKDDDRIYTERVKLDKEFAQKLVERGQRIALSDRMPEPLSADPSWYECKLCDAHEFCHSTKMTKEVNCRTCANSAFLESDEVLCERWGDNVPNDFQVKGCGSHVLHPDLVPWPRKDSDQEWQAIYFIAGKNVRNGESSFDVFTSKEIVSNPLACATPTDEINYFRVDWDGEIIG